jgi:hypothetical protein
VPAEASSGNGSDRQLRTPCAKASVEKERQRGSTEVSAM